MRILELFLPLLLASGYLAQPIRLVARQATSTFTDPRDSVYQSPDNLDVIRLNDTSVVLKWDLPWASESHVSFFKVQYRSTRKDSPQQVWKTVDRDIPPTTKAYQINGLRPGGYFFRVAAVYENDDSVQSQPLKYRLRLSSKIPSDDFPAQKAPEINWTEANSDYIRFKWKYDAKPKDLPDFGFLVYYKAAHNVGDFTIYNTLESSVEIGEVEPETTYEAKVVAYNNHGVSEFSDTIRIKTAPKSTLTNTTTASPVQPDAPQAPSGQDQTTYETTPPTRKQTDSVSNPNPEVGTNQTKPQLTSSEKPPVAVTDKPISLIKKNSTISTSLYPSQELSSHSLEHFFAQLIWSQDSVFTVIRYSLCALVILVILIYILATLIRRRSRDKPSSSPSCSTNESMQFDLEINCYFKNSFPGVEKEYPSINLHHQAHHGFVNDQ